MKFFGAIFGVIGLGMLAGAIFAGSRTLSFRADSREADGVVVDLASSRDSDGDTMYKPVVEWTGPDGSPRKLTGSVGSSPASHSRGERVKVRYKPGVPESARLDSFMENWFLSLILGFLGVIFTGIGAGVTIHEWRKRKNRQWLAQNGQRIEAKFTGVHFDTSLKVNGRSPWRLAAQWQHPATGAIHTFQSDAIWFDPSEYVKTETLNVLINPDQPSVYHIDIEFLPKHAG